jgi:hypothetical protein
MSDAVSDSPETDKINAINEFGELGTVIMSAVQRHITKYGYQEGYAGAVVYASVSPLLDDYLPILKEEAKHAGIHHPKFLGSGVEGVVIRLNDSIAIRFKLQNFDLYPQLQVMIPRQRPNLAQIVQFYDAFKWHGCEIEILPLFPANSNVEDERFSTSYCFSEEYSGYNRLLQELFLALWKQQYFASDIRVNNNAVIVENLATGHLIALLNDWGVCFDFSKIDIKAPEKLTLVELQTIGLMFFALNRNLGEMLFPDDSPILTKLDFLYKNEYDLLLFCKKSNVEFLTQEDVVITNHIRELVQLLNDAAKEIDLSKWAAAQEPLGFFDLPYDRHKTPDQGAFKEFLTAGGTELG